MIGHEILNPYGQRIRVSARTLDALDCRGYLHRDKATGLKHIDRKSFLVFIEAERGTNWWYELGDDGSGPNVVKCSCRQCQDRTDVDDVRLSRIRTEQIVREARQQSRRAA